MRNVTDKLQNKILPQDSLLTPLSKQHIITSWPPKTHFNSPWPPTLMSPCLFLKMPSAECRHVNAAVTNTLHDETVSFTFILCLGMENSSSNVRQRGNCAKRISRHLWRKNVIGIQNTPFRQWKEGGLIFSSLSPLSPCLSPHLPDPASPQPAQQSERICVAPTGGGVGVLGRGRKKVR